MGDDTQNDSELAEETELGSEMAGHSAEMSSILGDAYRGEWTGRPHGDHALIRRPRGGNGCGCDSHVRVFQCR